MMDRWTVVFMLFVLCSAGAMPEEDDPAELQDAIWAWALHEQKVLNSQELNSCVGRHLDAKWDMVKRSFPQAWPAKGSEDGFCGTKERAVDALCNQADLSFYLQVRGRSWGRHGCRVRFRSHSVGSPTDV